MSVIHENKIAVAYAHAEQISEGEIPGYDRAHISSRIRSAHSLSQGLDEDLSDATEEAIFRAVDELYHAQGIISISESSSTLRDLYRKIDEAIAALKAFGQPIIS